MHLNSSNFSLFTHPAFPHSSIDAFPCLSIPGGATKDSMKVTITSFRAVAEWKWNLPEDADDTCGICRVNFEGACAKCKFPGDDCPIMIGQCTHCFHTVSETLR